MSREHNFNIYKDKNGDIIISTLRIIQVESGSSYMGEYGSVSCYQPDYDEYEYKLNITLDEMREGLDELDYFVDNFNVETDTVESLTKMFDFIYGYTEYYKEIEDYLDEKASESAEEGRESDRLSAEEDAYEDKCEARAERLYDMLD